VKKSGLNYPKNTRFVCSKCGICCADTLQRQRHILFLQGEAEKISGFVGKQISEFAGKIEGKSPYVFEMKKTQDGRQCLFLMGNKCAIYLKRPIICRFYPFELIPTTKKGFEFRGTDECPGLGKGKLLTKGYFQRLFQIARLSTRIKRRS